MRGYNIKLLLGTLHAASVPLMIALPAFAVDSNIGQVENFMRSIIQLIAGLAGLVATGFFVVGGFTYITSSGNVEHLDRAKKTITRCS